MGSRWTIFYGRILRVWFHLIIQRIYLHEAGTGFWVLTAESSTCITGEETGPRIYRSVNIFFTDTWFHTPLAHAQLNFKLARFTRHVHSLAHHECSHQRLFCHQRAAIKINKLTELTRVNEDGSSNICWRHSEGFITVSICQFFLAITRNRRNAALFGTFLGYCNSFEKIGEFFLNFWGCFLTVPAMSTVSSISVLYIFLPFEGAFKSLSFVRGQHLSCFSTVVLSISCVLPAILNLSQTNVDSHICYLLLNICTGLWCVVESRLFWQTTCFQVNRMA